MNSLRFYLMVAAAILISCQPISNNRQQISSPTVNASTSMTPVSWQQPNVTEAAAQTTPIPLLTIPPTPFATIPHLPEDTEEATMILATLVPRPPSSKTPTHISTEKTDLTPSPTATVEPTATYWPTVTRQQLSVSERAGLLPCKNRAGSNDLLFIVTQQFPLPESYIPADLVLLTDYFENDITLGQPLYVRQVVIDPLKRMIVEMNKNGLRPSIISAYRSYQEQAMAWRWWSNQYPGRAAIMSARPGESEHQLGTTVDFGSPELNHLFHVDFATTAEGIWLANNAHRFGFTLSYPPDSYDITGFKYEPWHYRYVGTEMAEYLFNSGQILTSWQIINHPAPCIP